MDLSTSFVIIRKQVQGQGDAHDKLPHLCGREGGNAFGQQEIFPNGPHPFLMRDLMDSFAHRLLTRDGSGLHQTAQDTTTGGCRSTCTGGGGGGGSGGTQTGGAFISHALPKAGTATGCRMTNRRLERRTRVGIRLGRCFGG